MKTFNIFISAVTINKIIFFTFKVDAISSFLGFFQKIVVFKYRAYIFKSTNNVF